MARRKRRRSKADAKLAKTNVRSHGISSQDFEIFFNSIRKENCKGKLRIFDSLVKPT